MGDGSRKKKHGGNKKNSYYSLTCYDEETESVGDGGEDDGEGSIKNRVAMILAETELNHSNQDIAAESDGRLDFNDNLFGGSGSLRGSRSLDFELSDDEFQSAESRSDAGKPDLETDSLGDDFVQITRTSPEDMVRGVGSTTVDGITASSPSPPTSGSVSETSPRTSWSTTKRSGKSDANPLSVVYVKQKPITELYDGNFIDDDILQPTQEDFINPNISQELLPMPTELTLELEEGEEEEDGVTETGSTMDAQPIMFRKSSQGCLARNRNLVIAVSVVASLVALAGLAAIIYFAVTYAA